ncbi:MAG: CotH kinase family protein [Bacilli bacterium]|nr:CotH kinase family protein [Bacilli bacterium]
MKNRILFLLLMVFVVTGCNTRGPQGIQGEVGPQGPAGQDGRDGVSVVSIEKTSSDGLVDTYTISYSNGTFDSFTVTNGANGSNGINGQDGKPGADGKDGADGHSPIVTIGNDGYWYIDGEKTEFIAQGPKGDTGAQGPQGEQGPQGPAGQDGKSIVSITKTQTDGLTDTYTIVYSDNTTSIFTVTNGQQGAQGIQGVPGKDGITPEIYIGENGNWFINGVDSNVKAVGSDGNTTWSNFIEYNDKINVSYLPKKGSFLVGEFITFTFSIKTEYIDDYELSAIVLNETIINVDELNKNGNEYSYPTTMIEGGYYVKPIVSKINHSKTVELDGFNLTISHKPGVYYNSFDLSFKVNTNKDIKIKYSLDCSEVSEDSSSFLTPIEIREDTNFSNSDYILTNKVIGEYNFSSAKSQGYIDKVINTGNYPHISHSNVVNLKLYYQGKEIYKTTLNYLVTKNETLRNNPVIFVNMPDQKWINDADDDKTGFGNGLYNCFKSENEERANIYFNDGKEQEFEVNSQIKIGGNYTRGYPQKTLNLNFKKNEYGEKQSAIKLDLFNGTARNYENKKIENFKRFRIWNRGNNFETQFLCNDIICQDVARKLNLKVATSGHRECFAYYNGEFWGAYYLREKVSSEYIESHYGVDKDDIVVFKNNQIDDGDNTEKAQQIYDEMINYLTNNSLAIDSNYNYFIDKYIDIDSYVDYISYCAYINAQDFIGNNNNNVMWLTTKSKKKEFYDQKFRFVLYDLDSCVGNKLTNQNVLDPDYKYNWYNDLLFSSMIKNDKFRNSLYTKAIEYRDMHLANMFIDEINEISKTFLELYKMHIQRWQSTYDFNEASAYLNFYNNEQSPIFKNRDELFIDVVNKYIL